MRILFSLFFALCQPAWAGPVFLQQARTDEGKAIVHAVGKIHYPVLAPLAEQDPILPSARRRYQAAKTKYHWVLLGKEEAVRVGFFLLEPAGLRDLRREPYLILPVER